MTNVGVPGVEGVEGDEKLVGRVFTRSGVSSEGWFCGGVEEGAEKEFEKELLTVKSWF